MINDRKIDFICCFLLRISIFLLIFSFLGIRSAIPDDRIINVGVYENAPKVFISESGKPAGIFIDIIEHIAKVEGWKLRYVPGTWAEGLDRLSKGDIDIMPDVAYTMDRAKIYAFHKIPVLSSWSQVYAKDNSGVRSILDLDGKRIAVLQSSVQQEAFNRLSESFGLKITLISTPDYKKAFEMVAKNEADAAICNNFFGFMNAKKYGLEDTAVVFSPSKLLFAFHINAPKDLPDIIDRRLTAMKEDTESAYYKSLKRWTSENIQFNMPEWLKIVGLVMGVALFMSLAGSLILKHQVNARTRELKQINQEMEQRIIERTAELAAAMEKAQEADRIKSAFLATMSHELRTPLNSIIGFTGIMIQGLAGPLNPEQQKQMTMVQKSARHLLALINDVLDISKIEAGQLNLSFASFDLKTSIEKTLKLVTPMAEKNNIALRMDISEELGTIKSDQRRIEQVILNILNNAVKFTEKGHVTISCSIENNHCVLKISDTGIGMKPEEITHIFKPFHQIDTGLARKREGTGLGLSICKKILDMMEGSISVESKWGQGSTFTIRFPRHQGGSP